MTAKSAAADCFSLGDEMIGVGEARELLRARLVPAVGREIVPLDRAAGRILAGPLHSPGDVPAFDNVAVDGYAFRGADLAEHGPTRLRLLPGRAAAGHAFPGLVHAGAAVKALTGAPMPAGADTVAMWEEVEAEPDTVVIPESFRAGANRRRAGEDIRAGQMLFAAGLRLLPQHIGVAAELGLAQLEVFERLEIALLSSGDELREPGEALSSGSLHDANRYILKALLANLPVSVTDLGIVRDERETVHRVLEGAAARHHVILASGGASRGEEDHLAATVGRMGRLHFWQIRMKPGRPLALGTLGDAAFVGLPGNPVAATVCFLLFARPMILRLAGGSWREPRGFEIPAGFSMRKRPGRTELLRGRLERSPAGTLTAQRIRREGSGILTSLTDADGLIEVAEDRIKIEPGEPVKFLTFAELGAGG
jgi:molybdopterin molybdotransferase